MVISLFEKPNLKEKFAPKRRLLIDIDGVICEYNFPFLVRKFFGVDISKFSIYAYDLADVLGVSTLDIDTMFKEQVYGKPRFTEGAMETLKEWESKLWEIIIYSNRVKYMGYEGLAKWLIEYKIPFDNIDLTGTGIYNYQIDDSPAKLMSTNSITKLLYSQPWNQGCLNITGKLQRVSSWAEIREEVNGIQP